MAKNKTNQKPDEKPATEVTSENQVTENVEQTEETAEKAADEAAEEATEKTVPTDLAQMIEKCIEKCEVVIKAKGTSIKMIREVFFAIEKDPLRRVNLVKLKDTPAAREMVKSAAEKFLRECTKK